MSAASPPYRIRPAVQTDVPAIAALHLEAMRALHSIAPPGFGATLGTPPSIAEVEEQFAAGVADDAAVVFVSESEAGPAGFVMGAIEEHGDDLLDAPFMTVQYLAVAERHRGRGVARALLEAIEAAAATRGITTLDLLIWESNARARGLYETQGYSTLERRMVKRLS
jgi:ribosomal protein S18 acetylase RimI-like enzyme